MSEFLDYEDIVPDMYYAITINSDGIITGKHESQNPINNLQFYNNPWLHGDIVRGVAANSQYIQGTHINCYNDDGTYKGLVWAIENHYETLPDGYEIVDGEIKEIALPEPKEPDYAPEPMPDTTPTLSDYAIAIEKQSQEIAELKEMIRLLSEKIQ